MHTSEENGIANEAIVLLTCSNHLTRLQSCEKWWAAQCKMLLFCPKNDKERKIFWPSGNFHDAFSCHWACCLSWKNSKMNGTLLKSLSYLFFFRFWKILYYHTVHVCAIPTYRVYRLCDSYHNRYTAFQTQPYLHYTYFSSWSLMQDLRPSAREIAPESPIEQLWRLRYKWKAK